MNNGLLKVKQQVYDQIGFRISNFEAEIESFEYDACRFQLNRMNVVCRNAKITPKKVGQFVTFWKRNEKGVIEPFFETDKIDFYLVNVRTDKQFGQFVFPKSVLVEKRIISTDKKEGKRAFRVYPSWDIAKSKQAEQSQKWQLGYFYEIGNIIDFKKVIDLYKAV